MRGADEGATEAYSCTPQGDPEEATKQMGPYRRRATARKTLHLPSDASSVDIQRLAGDVARFVGRQEGRGVADVVGGLFAFHGDDVGDAFVEDLAWGHAG